MENIYEIIGKLLAAVFVGLLAYLVPKTNAWFETSSSEATQKRLRLLVQSFTRAAEQLYHDTDPGGEARNQFVREQLTELGIEITDAVISMIEAEVWAINTENRKAQVQNKAISVWNKGYTNAHDENRCITCKKCVNGKPQINLISGEPVCLSVTKKDGDLVCKNWEAADGGSK